MYKVNILPGSLRSVAQSFRALMICIGFIATSNFVFGQALMTNNGTLIAIKPGAIMIAKTGTVHNAVGYISNEGLFTIEKDFVNDASAAGGDTAAGGTGRGLYRVQNNWVNNGVYIPDSGTVELYGDTQLITGTSPTTFYDLKLTGTGVKVQTINAAALDSLVLNDRELATVHYKMHVMNVSHGAVSKTPGNLGFVSSLDSGRLAWDVDSNALYLFPTGSSLGTARYRPIIIRPNLNTPQTFEVRMANNNADADNYNRADKQNTICKINDTYYHLIGRPAGSDPVQLTLLYDPVADGGWNMIAHWQNLPEWEAVGAISPGTFSGFSTLTVPGWNDFTLEPFGLARQYPAIDSATVDIRALNCYRDSSGAIKINVAGGTPPYTYLWIPINSTDSSISGLQAGQYQVLISDTFGCTDTSRLYTVPQPPQIQIADTVNPVKCHGGSTGAVSLAIDSAALPIASYQWSNTQTTQNINQLPAGSYTVTVTDAHDCKRDTSINVPEPDSITLAPTVGDLLCYKGNDGSINLGVMGGTPGAPAYTYQWSDSSGINDSIRTNLPAGTYHITVTDANGCQDTSSYTLSQPDSIIVTAGYDTIIAITYSAPLEVLTTSGGTGAYSYFWSPDSTLNDSTGASVIATPSVTTVYTVKAIDANGCTATDTVHIKVDVNLYTVPDGFTPNGDGRNDVFAIITTPVVQVVEFKVFNRWGQLLSENTQGWDGNFNGKPQPMDTYVYQATIRMPNGNKVPKSGDFILIR